MSSYQKFTLQTIRDNLKSGKYANATGANRAIGKTQELSASDKDKAKALVAKHFGVEAKPAKKAPAKKAPAKKAPAKKAPAKKAATKKAAAKPAKTAKAAKAAKAAPAKKAPAKKTEKVAKPAKAAKAAAKPAKTEKVAAKGRAKKAPSKTNTKAAAAKRSPKAKASCDADAAPAMEQASTLIQGATRKLDSKRLSALKKSEAIGYVGRIVESLCLAIKTMESAKTIFPKVSFDEGVSTAQSALSKTVAMLDREVLGGEESTVPASKTVSAAKAPTKPAAKAVAKTTAKKVKKTKGGVTAAPETPAAEGRQINGVPIDQDLLERDDITDDDRLNMQLAREHAPKVAARMGGNSGTQSAEA